VPHKYGPLSKKLTVSADVDMTLPPYFRANTSFAELTSAKKHFPQKPEVTLAFNHHDFNRIVNAKYGYICNNMT